MEITLRQEHKRSQIPVTQHLSVGKERRECSPQFEQDRWHGGGILKALVTIVQGPGPCPGHGFVAGLGMAEKGTLESEHQWRLTFMECCLYARLWRSLYIDSLPNVPSNPVR